MTIEIETLAGCSVIEQARSQRRPIDYVTIGESKQPLEIARANDVAYLPSALLPGQSLQIVQRRLIPVEAVFDEFTVEFVRSHLLQNRAPLPVSFERATEVGDVCILGNVFSRNFAHWHEELMKVIVLEAAGIECTYVISALPAFARELLELLGVPSDRVHEVDVPTIFHSALYTTPVSYRNASEHPEVLFALRAALLSAADGADVEFGPALWLKRQSQTRLGRSLVNVEEVKSCLENYGLFSVDLGALPVRHQIAAAMRATVMCGVHGAQFVHSQLMPSGSSVVECFSPLYLNPTYTEIYRVMRHRYFQICGANTPAQPYKFGGDVHVDCQQLDLALSGVFGGIGAGRPAVLD